MNIGELRQASEDYSRNGLYRGAFETLLVSIHRQIDYANNVLLVEADHGVRDEVLVVYSIHEEAIRCLYWTEDNVNRYVEALVVVK